MSSGTVIIASVSDSEIDTEPLVDTFSVTEAITISELDLIPIKVSLPS